MYSSTEEFDCRNSDHDTQKKLNPATTFNAEDADRAKRQDHGTY